MRAGGGATQQTSIFLNRTQRTKAQISLELSPNAYKILSSGKGFEAAICELEKARTGTVYSEFWSEVADFYMPNLLVFRITFGFGDDPTAIQFLLQI